jgi:hypothetical protein
VLGLIVITIIFRHATGARALTAAVHLACDWVGDVGQLLLLLFKVFGRGGGGVLLDPVLGFLNSLEELMDAKLVIWFQIIE